MDKNIMVKWFFCVLLSIAKLSLAHSQNEMTSFSNQRNKSFDIIALGTSGGIDTHDLSAFLISPHQQNVGITCDAGSLVSGIEKAIEYGSFSDMTIPADYPLKLSGFILRKHIKGHLISHAHLDHIAGLIIASPDDVSKPIYALPSVLDNIKSHYFNWQAWPNFADSGVEPTLAKYAFINLAQSKQQAIAIKNTTMTVSALPLSHNGVESTAFVIENEGSAVLCMGDTGPDTVEKATNLHQLWEYVAPLIKKGQLKAIIIESSFLNDTPDSKLFGHLTPYYVNESLKVLRGILGDKNLLKDMPVIISHIKPSLKAHDDVKALMLEQLEKNNETGVQFIVPQQGQKWQF